VALVGVVERLMGILDNLGFLVDPGQLLVKVLLILEVVVLAVEQFQDQIILSRGKLTHRQ